MSAKVLTDGSVAPGLAFASALRSFLGPHLGRCLRAWTMASSSHHDTARGLDLGRRERSMSSQPLKKRLIHLYAVFRLIPNLRHSSATLCSLRMYWSMIRSRSVTGDISIQGKVSSLPQVSPMSPVRPVTRSPISDTQRVTHVSRPDRSGPYRDLDIRIAY